GGGVDLAEGSDAPPTDQKVGGSSPSERAPRCCAEPQVSPGVSSSPGDGDEPPPSGDQPPSSHIGGSEFTHGVADGLKKSPSARASAGGPRTVRGHAQRNASPLGGLMGSRRKPDA